MKTIEVVDTLLDRLHAVAREQLILIAPLTSATELEYEYVLQGKIPYVLPAGKYFRSKYGDRVDRLDSDPSMGQAELPLLLARHGGTRSSFSKYRYI